MTGGIRENSSKMLGKGRGEEHAECKYKNTKGGGPTKHNRKRRSGSEGCVRGIYIGFSKDISKTTEILWVGGGVELLEFCTFVRKRWDKM
jgi:hypothetical protein